MTRYAPWALLGLCVIVAGAWYARPAMIGAGEAPIKDEPLADSVRQAREPHSAGAQSATRRRLANDDEAVAHAAGISGAVVSPLAPEPPLRGDDADGDFTSEESDRRADERVRAPHPMLTPEVMARMAAWQEHATQRGLSPAVLNAAILDKIRAASGQPPSKEDFLSILPADLRAELDEITRLLPPPL